MRNLMKESVTNINMGSIDRKIRIFAVAPALVVAGLLIGPGGVVAVILYVLAGVMVATSLVGSCPLYSVFGIKTCPADTTSASAAAER
jgi:hypothetical protein